MQKHKIDILIMDVDGTLTDGKIYMSETKELIKVFNIKDGYGIKDKLPLVAITPIILTGRNSKITEVRCQELGITVIYQGVANKLIRLKAILLENQCNGDAVAYIGDDLNDFEAMQYVKSYGGVVACPADATPEIVEISDFIATANGGCGAVREFIDWLIKNYS